MRVPVSWLKELVEVTLPTPDLARRLTMAGLEVSAIEHIGDQWQNCFVGEVSNVEPHPNADRLVLCTVNLDHGQYRVVCGAPNVREGQKIAFATVGANLHSGADSELQTLEPTRIRGVVSEGMICSERELGSGNDHTGILVLPETAPIGMPLSEYLGDEILHIEVTPNRVDALSVLGVAYEVAAICGSFVKEPELFKEQVEGDGGTQLSVEVSDVNLCPRYTMALVCGVRVEPSPKWMQDRLVKSGMRPINNVVDITNYVMLEYGQPLHAFDRDKLDGGKIFVRPAHEGETLVSLDQVKRTLEPPMLVIADNTRPVGLAGVIGAQNSEVVPETTAVLLEAAAFHPFNTRRTSENLRVRTEASLRFEKGLRPGLPPVGIRRALQLLLEFCGGTVSQGIIDTNSQLNHASTIRLTMGRLRQVMGIDIPITQVRDALTSLGFNVAGDDGESFSVIAPYWRADIEMQDDLVEEVARIIGYDQIPTISLSNSVPHFQPNRSRDLKEQMRTLLVSLGFQEIISYPLVSREQIGMTLGSDADALGLMKLSNPISPEYEYLRIELTQGILKTLSSNQRFGDGPLHLFELGRVFIPRKGDLPDEREMMMAVLVGPRSPLSWSGLEGVEGFFDAKGIFEAVLHVIGIVPEFEPIDDLRFRPGRSASVRFNGCELGRIGEILPLMLQKFDIQLDGVLCFTLDLQAILETDSVTAQRFIPSPRFPDATRDLALLADENLPAQRIQQIIEEHPLVIKATVFDIFSGAQVPAGEKSMTYRLQFQSPTHTLTNDEVNEAVIWLLDQLADRAGVKRRDS